MCVEYNINVQRKSAHEFGNFNAPFSSALRQDEVLSKILLYSDDRQKKAQASAYSGAVAIGNIPLNSTSHNLNIVCDVNIKIFLVSSL